MNCFHSFRTNNKLEQSKVCKAFFVNKVCKGFFDIFMLSEKTKILEFNQYQKSDKAQFIVYANLECIMEKIDTVKVAQTTTSIRWSLV